MLWSSSGHRWKLAQTHHSYSHALCHLVSLEFAVHQRVSPEVVVQPWLVLASWLLEAAIQYLGSSNPMSLLKRSSVGVIWMWIASFSRCSLGCFREGWNSLIPWHPTLTGWWQPTHTDRYLDFLSHHPLHVKTCLDRCLYDRARGIITNDTKWHNAWL